MVPSLNAARRDFLHLLEARSSAVDIPVIETPLGQTGPADFLKAPVSILRGVLQERFFKQEMPVRIIGAGSIGDKAEQLLRKAPLLRSLGFRAPPRVVLAEDFFDAFFRRNGLGQTLSQVRINEQTAKQVSAACISAQELGIFSELLRSFNMSAYAVRSSAAGDARGTGIYETVFADNNALALASAVKRVLASYFTKDAVAFRENTRAEAGFGIIIEPLLGQEWMDLGFAPVLSGCAYTSHPRYPQGCLYAVPGLGGGVNTRGNERISYAAIQAHEGNLGRYIDSAREKLSAAPRFRESLLLQIGEYGNPTSLDGLVFTPNAARTTYSELALGVLASPWEQTDFKESLRRIELLPFFERMRQLEARLGTPQYVEWAMTLEGTRFVTWIVQIADVNRKVDDVDFVRGLDQVLLAADTVKGVGRKVAQSVVFIAHPRDLPALEQYNREHSDYILIYAGNLISNGGWSRSRRLAFSDCHRAAAVLELADAQHCRSAFEHWGTAFEQSGIFFGVLLGAKDFMPQWSKLGLDTSSNQFQISPKSVMIKASERHDRLELSPA